MRKLTLSLVLSLMFLSDTLASTVPIVQVVCTGGSGFGFTTLTLQTLGVDPVIIARIRQYDFDSGEIQVIPSERILIPETRGYVDELTQGKQFTFTFNFLNPEIPPFLEYHSADQAVPAMPELYCTNWDFPTVEQN